MAKKLISNVFIVFFLCIALLVSTSQGFSSQTNLWNGKRSAGMEQRSDAHRKEICGMCYRYCKVHRKREFAGFRLNSDASYENEDSNERDFRGV